MTAGMIIGIMAFFFLFFAIIGVPIGISIIGSVFIATAFTPISLPSIVGQLFNGVNSVPLLAVPFFLLAGELMSSTNITVRIIDLANNLVGHIRSGLAQVNTVFSLFFAGMSGSSTADVAAATKILAPEMKKHGYDPAFTAALIAATATLANMIPPSIMAIIYGSSGGVSIIGLFLGGIVPGVLIAGGIMAYCYVFQAPTIRKQRSTFVEISASAKRAALPLMIPIIIMGGILSGWFTPTEAGMIAVVYILIVAIPLLKRDHIRQLPKDFMHAGVLYSVPLIAVAGASAFGWMVAYLRAPDMVSSFIEGVAGTNPILILFFVVLLFIVVGQFVDAVPAIIIFMPIVNALVELGTINPVHMGVVVIITLAFGLITPPYGLALLLASSLSKVSFKDALIKTLPMYAVFLLTIALIVLVPDLVLWLPKLFMPESVGCFAGADGVYICP